VGTSVKNHLDSPRHAIVDKGKKCGEEKTIKENQISGEGLLKISQGAFIRGWVMRNCT